MLNKIKIVSHQRIKIIKTLTNILNPITLFANFFSSNLNSYIIVGLMQKGNSQKFTIEEIKEL